MPEIIEQRTAEWFAQRLGCVTGSSVADILSKPRSKAQAESAGRRNLKAKLALELMTGKPHDSDFLSWDMQRGIRLEPEARIEYELTRNATLESVGFVPHPRIKRFGASPDALVGMDGIVEIKAPNLANHIEYIRAGIIPSDYRKQILAELSCTERKWCDFVSYHPDMPPHLQLFIARMERDDIEIAEIEAEVIRFNEEVDELIALLPKEAA